MKGPSSKLSLFFTIGYELNSEAAQGIVGLVLGRFEKWRAGKLFHIPVTEIPMTPQSAAPGKLRSLPVAAYAIGVFARGRKSSTLVPEGIQPWPRLAVIIESPYRKGCWWLGRVRASASCRGWPLWVWADCSSAWLSLHTRETSLSFSLKYPAAKCALAPWFVILSRAKEWAWNSLPWGTSTAPA